MKCRIVNDLDTYFDREFYRQLEQVDRTSVPGYCQMSVFGSTNADVLGWNGLEYDPVRVEYLYTLVKKRLILLSKGTVERDDIKVFIKQEPHKRGKIEKGLYRLISAVSLVDTMVDRILFSWAMDGVLKRPLATPTAIGWTPLQGGYRLLKQILDNQLGPSGKVVCVDKSAWDWTVQGWLVDVWKAVLKGLCTAPDWWRVAVDTRFDALFEQAVFRFEDGSRVSQRARGIMKSGCYLTLLLNGMGQSALHYLINAYEGVDLDQNQPITMGDDTVQPWFDWFDRYLDFMRSLGPMIKGTPEPTDHIEFCGFYIANGVTWPAYWKKHLFRLKHLDEATAAETLEAYQFLYAFEPAMLNVVREEMWRRCPERILDVAVLRSFVDGVVKVDRTDAISSEAAVSRSG